MKAKDPYYIAKDIPGGSPKIHLGQGGLDARGTDGSKYGIHGTNQPSSIGKYISQGCIRMKKTMWNICLIAFQLERKYGL